MPRLTLRRSATAMLLAAVLLCATTVGQAATAATSPGPDSHAPQGAPASWLPSETWVMEHWLPYREADLYRLLGTDRQGLLDWLQQKPMDALVQSRGLDRRRIIHALLRPWRGRVSNSHLAVLRRRAVVTFTQRHLMQHMIGHLSHFRSVNEALPRILNTDRQEMARLQIAGYSVDDIGRMHGRSSKAILRAVLSVVRKSERHGVAAKWVPRSQARSWVARVTAAMPSLLAWRSGCGLSH